MSFEVSIVVLCSVSFDESLCVLMFVCGVFNSDSNPSMYVVQLNYFVGDIEMTIGGYSKYSPSSKLTVQLVRLSHLHVDLVFQCEDDRIFGKQFLSKQLSPRYHYFRETGNRSERICNNRTNVKTKHIVKILHDLKDKCHTSFTVVVSRFGCKHEWTQFQDLFRDKIVENPTNTWDFTLRMRDNDGKIIMFQRHGNGKAG